jgi:putative lipoprotein
MLPVGCTGALVATLVAGCSTPRPAHEMGVVMGTVTYRERMMIPPNTTLRVALEDVSRADAPAKVVVESAQTVSNGPPYAFELRFRSAEIDPSRRYNVRASLIVGGKAWFTSTEAVPVLTHGNSDVVEVLVSRSGK